MEIKFNISDFKGRANNLISILSHLKYADCYTPTPNLEIEAITCRTPSLALKFCRYVNLCGISPESEKVFLKNLPLGIRYLKLVKRQAMQDPAVQKRFWKRIVKKPELAFEWASAFKQRLSEEEEEVFANDMRCMREYAYHVIKGKFPEKVHQMILLKSFEPMSSYQKKAIEDYIKYVESK